MTILRTKLARVRHASDQAWSELRAIEPELRRIAYTGRVVTPKDRYICQMACLGIVAALGERAIDTVLPELENA